MDSFERNALGPVREYLGAARIQVPSGCAWRFDEAAGRVCLDIKAIALSQDMQKDASAAPSFLFCLAYWLERIRARPAPCLVNVTGEPPQEGTAREHWNRSTFVIDQLERALPERFVAQLPQRWTWPKSPILNVASKDPSDEAANTRGERVLETSICSSDKARDDFSAAIDPIARFRRHLPVGLFEESVSEATAWTPGASSQVDLWACSTDGGSVHLLELKAAEKVPLAILPQTIYYARLLNHLRVGVPGGGKIEGRCDDLDAIRSASRIQAWLVAPRVHPLLLSRRKESPLELLNASMRSDGLQFGILPIETTAQLAWSRWRFDERWPAAPVAPASPSA
jgi:hypothetical protein